ncbi:MAG: IS5 family transposase [Ginsengibacter sp.]
MAKASKNRASKFKYVSPGQLTLAGFDTPFSQNLDVTNRWVILAEKIPWDHITNIYSKQLNNKSKGANGINPRVVIGSLIIKHMCNFSDRETVNAIQENIYMQYFIGYSSFSNETPFDPSLFVDIRKRLGVAQINEINEKILQLNGLLPGVVEAPADKNEDEENKPEENAETLTEEELSTDQPPPKERVIAHEGELIVDATACPQDISYPTDLNLLNDAREKSEELIDFLCGLKKVTKPRTYRENARKEYLKVAQKKHKTKKEIRAGIKKQLSCLHRNVKNIYVLLQLFEKIPFKKKQYKYFLVIQTLYDQQSEMHKNRVHSIDDRIVSIHQPHVRPIVRGKQNAKVEFGAKIDITITNGFAFLEESSWDAYNEGTTLMATVERYRKRTGCYPKKIFADKIYCNRANRKELKELKIELVAKPLGRPSKAMEPNHIRPGDRNPVEGKFGQAKTRYGLNKVKARLSDTSLSWIATIIMVLNLVKLTGRVLYCMLRNEKIKLKAAIKYMIYILYYEINFWVT